MVKYSCPHCNGLLNVGEHIVFITRNQKGNPGLLLLSSEVGNYTYQANPEFKFEKGERFEFFCPLCQKNLKAEHQNAPLARIILTDEQNETFEILFSSIAGEHCTYKMSKQNKLESFGSHSAKYIDSINLWLK